MRQVIIVALGLLAQVLGIDPDLVQQVGTAAVAGLFIWGSVELLRKGPFSGLDGMQVNLLAGAVGLVFSVLLGVAEFISGGFIDWVIFAVQATFFATVTDFGLKKAGGSGNSPAPAG